MFTALIQQVLSLDKYAFLQLRNLYKLINNHSTWNEQYLWIFLRSLLHVCRERPIFCIIDGIDKCDQRQNYLIHDFISMKGLDESKTKLVVTSGLPTPKLESSNPFVVHLSDADGTQRSMKQFVEKQVEGLVLRDPSFSRFEHNLKAVITLPKANFLVSMLRLKWLEDLNVRSTPRLTEAALKSVPRSISEICDRRLLPNVRTTPTWVGNALQWITNSFRPLSTEELSVAVAILPDHDGFALVDEEIPRNIVKDLRCELGSFFCIHSGKVMHIHDSIPELLHQSAAWTTWNWAGYPTGHVHLAYVCIDYLLRTSSHEIDESTNDTSSTFLVYAAQHWHSHYRLARNKASLRVKALTLLANKKCMQKSFELKWATHHPATRQNVAFIDPILIAAQLDLDDLVSSLVDGTDLDYGHKSLLLSIASERGNQQLVSELTKRKFPISNALHLAIQNGHMSVVSILLDSGADLHKRDETGSTPLLVASRSGSKKIAMELINRGSDKMTTNMSGCTALHLSGMFGHGEIIEILVSEGCSIDVNPVDNQGATPLHLATATGQFQTMKILLKKGANVNARDHGSWTPLHHAAALGIVESLKLLMEFGAQVHEQTLGGMTALHLAVRSSNIAIVEELLNASVKLETVADGIGTTLHVTASTGVATLTSRLLGAGADPNATNHRKQTPLHLAAENGHLQVMQELLYAHSDVDALDDKGRTALHLAAAAGKLEAIKLLLRAQASISVIDEAEAFTPIYYAARMGDKEAVELLICAGADADGPEEAESSPLHVAAEWGNLDAVKTLKAAGADPEMFDAFSKTPLHIAAIASRSLVIETLLDWKVEIDPIDDEKNTPLMLSIASQNTMAVEKLLENRANTSLSNRMGFTPLHLAARCGNSHIVSLLLRKRTAKQAGVLARDYKGRIPLHIAAQGGHDEIARMLLSVKCRRQIRMSDRRGRVPLNLAAKYGKTNVAEIFVEKGAAMEAREFEGMTPLHLAAKKGHYEMVEYLLKQGVSVDKRNNQNQTSLHTAAQNGFRGIVRLLLQSGADPRLRDEDNLSLLHYAAETGDSKLVQSLLGFGSQLSTKTSIQKSELHIRAMDYFTPLSLAAQYGDAETVDVLIKAGALDLREAVGDHWSPLLGAAERGSEEICIMLLNAGANRNFVNDVGKTPLYYAIQNGHLELVKKFLELGSEANASKEWPAMFTAVEYHRLSIVQEFLDRGMETQISGRGGWTPLHAARYDAQISRRLLEAGAKVDAEDDEGRTPLYLASDHRLHEKVDVLLEKGANPLKKNNQGTTPLFVAMLDGHQKIVEVMFDTIDSDTNTYRLDDEQKLSLMCEAIRNRAKEIVTLLLFRAGVDVRQPRISQAALKSALETEDDEMALLLIQRGMIVGNMATQLLILSSVKGNMELMEYSLRNGADVHGADEHGWTAATHALALHQTEARQKLLSRYKTNQSELVKALRPTLLCETLKSSELHLEPDKLTVRYTGGHDTGK